jgi:hypothetical protein
LNVNETEQPSSIIAKMCACEKEGSTRKVTYSFVDSYHSLCLDKRDIIFEELNACERLLKYSTDYNIDDDGIEKKAIEFEIAYLKMILDLMP